MTKQCTGRKLRMLARRTLAGLLALVLVCGLLPAVTLPVQAASWAQEYLDTLVAWGVMRGDINGNLNPDMNITRAEFVTMMNRAYGYDEVGGNPFLDVVTGDWYYDDIDIAYNVGYFNGTSRTTATPNGYLTREQAVVLLGRNMMLQESAGETLGFSDSRNFSDWSRGLISSAVDNGIITGMSDGTFAPQRNITRAEVAAMLVRAIGTLVQTPGDHNLGSVYGNVTINTSGVNLRNTVIAGDLYLTGGIGLGNVLLENVTVLGKIVTSGAGESNSSESSVILRNVSANSMVVDSINNQFVTVRSEGNTNVGVTSVRTHAYVEDAAPAGLGLTRIELDGENGIELQLAGNIKEVVNMTPTSRLVMALGSAEKVTVDEKAVGSTVTINNGARITELNLDVGTNVSGAGDIDTLNVSAAGSNVSMLPDTITVRPGITANIAGTSMDNVTAAESSADPRLLAGYPVARDVAPTTANLVFSTNKAGTIYWAVTALADGSVDEETLIAPPSYGGIILKSGTINATASKTEYTAKVTGLTSDGSYYVTAVLVDSRGQRSPVKSNAFTTPDDTVPGFATGYPVMSLITNTEAQVTVMPTKSCQLYYAVLPKGSTAPRAQDFKSAAISGNLGYGAIDVVKNVTRPITVNNVPLVELESYDLYLWLTDYDGAKSSAVRKVSFTTVDRTPPMVTSIMQTNSAASSVEVTYTLNEPGTLYWAIVAEGNNTFMTETTDEYLSSLEAKVKLESGVGTLRKGSSNAARAETDIRLAIAGLNTNATNTTSYTLYYIAKDRAGNYGEIIQAINVRTLDSDAPTVTQEFTKYNENDTDKPLADTNIQLIFSEMVKGSAKTSDPTFLELYNDIAAAGNNTAQANEARDRMAAILQEHIQLYIVPATGRPYLANVRDSENENDDDIKAGDWVIDYRFAEISLNPENGKLTVEFPTSETKSISALNLGSGTTYYFHVQGIYDNSQTPNAMGAKDLPQFRTVFAQVSLSIGDTWTITNANDENGNKIDFTPNNLNDPQRIDIDFLMDPISVDRVDQGMCWDLLIWTNTTMTYTLYSRPKTGGTWKREGQATIAVDSTEEDGFAFLSLTRHFRDKRQTPTFAELRNMNGLEFAIHVDKIGDSGDFTSWNHNIIVKANVVAGTQYQMSSLTTGSFVSQYNEAISGGVSSIGTPDPFTIRKPFTDSTAPDLVDGYPTITVGDITADINVMLNRPGRVYYIVFPLTQLREGTQTINGADIKLDEDTVSKITDYTTSVRVEVGTTGKPLVKDIPNLKLEWKGKVVSLPTVNTVTSGNLEADVIKGSTNNVAANVATTIHLTDLTPNTIYYVCMVTRGTSAIYDDEVICYRFTTEEAIRPTINLSATGSTVNVTVDRTTQLDYFLALNGSEGQDFQRAFSAFVRADAQSGDGKWTECNTYSPNGSGSSKGVYNFYFNYGTASTATESMTVVDAMATPCYQGSTYVGSVFDIFASTEAKNTYAALVRSSSVSGNEIVMTGSGTFTEAGNNSSRNQVACQNMSMGVMYTFLSVGKSANGSGDAFRAYYPVSRSDTDAPVITAVAPNSLVWERTTGDNPRKTGKLLSGTLTLVFSESLYAVDVGSTTQRTYPVDKCVRSTVSMTHITDYEAIALGNLVTQQGTSTSGITVDTDATHVSGDKGQVRPISTINLNLANIEGSASVSFSSSICDQARNGLDRTPLTITVKIERTGAGTDADPYDYDISYTITRAWDGRE